ncbi:hypothetical protein ES332_A03G082300v1 [Gossypium tomentosum]|uniref:Aspartyl aminopeptidase n=1 Tax=Gossypium tomentosum TaxID=34277 RepID=A0A5D2R737_GOSTO|nr:hypothetical protein ES332_A03G082300v1 [Gossypium tomentosum]
MADTEVCSVVSDFIDFLNASPTAFHAVGNPFLLHFRFGGSLTYSSPFNLNEAKKRLQKVGYEQVVEREDWKLEAGKRYFLTRNHSTIVAFAIVFYPLIFCMLKYVVGNGFHIVGAHTDSPCLKLKPVSEVKRAGYLEVGVQTYGGGLWHTWFDRDLTVAGRAMIREEKGGSVSYSHRLVRIEEPIMRVPTLASHLDSILDRNYFVIACLVSRGVNDGFKVNTQSHLLPVLATSVKVELNKEFAENGLAEKTTNKSRHHAFLLQMIANKLRCQPDQICDFELQACDTQPSIALIDATSSDNDLENESGVRMVALFDHEEVGSNSAEGAGSLAMLDALSRITYSFTSASKMLAKAIQRSFLVSADMAHALHPNYMMLAKAIQRSFLVSADMAHALHPNYMDKHEESHQPKLHRGLVIKHNANQRYATNAVTSFIFREIAVKHNLPIQVSSILILTIEWL